MKTLDTRRVVNALRRWREAHPGTGRIEVYRDTLGRPRSRVNLVGLELDGARIVEQSGRNAVWQCPHGSREVGHKLGSLGPPRFLSCPWCYGFQVGDVICGFRITDIVQSPHDKEVDGHRRVRLRCLSCGHRCTRRATLVRAMKRAGRSQCGGCHSYRTDGAQ